MKILFTVQTYYPLKDGVSNVTRYLAEGLASNGHSVTVATSSYYAKGTAVSEFCGGVLIRRYDLWTNKGVCCGEKVRYLREITEMASDVDVIVNVCTQQAFTDVLLPALNRMSCKKVLYMHGMAPQRPRISLSQGFLSNMGEILKTLRWNVYYASKKDSLRAFDAVIQLHELDEAAVFFREKLGVECHIIENAADDEFFRRLPYEQDCRYALQVANYMDRKNQASLLEAFYEAGVDDLALKLIGSERNSYCDGLIRLKADLDVKYGERDVEILYGLSREKTVEYIKKAYLNLSLSKWEAFPISIIESVAAGVPFISSDVGVVRFVPGGVLADEPREMAYWLKELCRNRELRDNLARTCTDYADKNYTKIAKIEYLEDLLEGLCG